MAYTSQTLIEQYLQRSLTASEVSFLSTLIPAVKLYIDQKLNTTFDSVSATTRVYEGGVQHLDIDPASNITAVASLNDDGTTSYTYTVNDEYTLSPANSTIKTEIIARGFKFPFGDNRIAVTASFSEYDGAVPQDIQMVATRLCAGIINQGKVDSSGGNVSSESLEGHSISYDTSVSSVENLADNDPVIRATLDARKSLLLG